MEARIRAYRPRMLWYCVLLFLAVLTRGPFGLLLLEFVGGMTFVSLAVDLAQKAMVFRPNKQRALRVATAMVRGSAAGSIIGFLIASRGGGAEYARQAVWCALFCGEGVLHYVEHIRRSAAAVPARPGRE